MGDAIDDELVEFYYQWNRFEKTNDVEIIDCDLVQRSADFPGTFDTREDAAARLDELVGRYKTLKTADRFALHKLESSVMFLRALSGEDVPFPQYIAETIGVLPEMIPEGILAAARADCGARLQFAGYQFTPDSLRAFLDENRLNTAEIRAEFELAQQSQLPAILDWLGLDVATNYELQLVDVDESWMAEVKTTDEGTMSLKFNINEERIPWIRGDPECTVLHEVCGHVLQSAAWTEGLKAGAMPPVCGLTTLHGPESYVQEGVAETLSWFFPRALLSDAGELAVRLHCMSELHWNNAFIMAGRNRSTDEILEFLEDHMLTYRTREQRRKRLETATQDPLQRAYMYSYGISIYHHRLFADSSSSAQNRHYLTQVFGRTYSYRDLAHSYEGWHRQPTDRGQGY